MFAINLGKYKNILLSVALFLLLDASVLILNFYISFEIADDAVSINLAGRQRMLSQRMTKSLLDVEYSYNDDEQKTAALAELRTSRNLFNDTLTAFDLGGNITGADGSLIELNKAKDAGSLKAIKEGKLIWSEYKNKIDQVIEKNSTSALINSPASVAANHRDNLNKAIVFGRENNLQLLTLMNDLTVSLENVASSKAQTLRLIQTAGILMALINFFIILFHFIRQLNDGDKVIEAARKETSEILETVTEGLFLIDREFNIGSQRSDSLYEILNINEHQDHNLKSLLKDIISEKDIETTEGFLRLLFKPDIKEKLIGDLNPLNQIQVNIDDGDGSHESKHLSFEFKRVVENGNIKDILVTVNDITDKINLEKKLLAEKEKNENQIRMLTTILQVNPDLIKAFMRNAFVCYSNINKLLKKTAKSQSDFLNKVDAIYTEIHGFKGEAGALDMDEMVTIAHRFEDQLDRIKKLKTLRGQDFLPLTVMLDQLINHSQSITELMNKLSSFDKVINRSDADNNRPNTVDDTTISAQENDWNHLYKFSQELAFEYDKEVMLVMSGFQEAPLPESLRDTINSVAIQFLRNAIVHGIETPATRKGLDKSLQGRIDLTLAMTSENTVEFLIKDDGGGINIDRIIDTAVASGNWSRQQLEGWDTKRLLSLIFEPGFSTAEQTDHHAGRGVGMGVIVDKIKQFRGKIKVHSRSGRYSQFTITFPMPSISNQVA